VFVESFKTPILGSSGRIWHSLC